MPSGSVQSTLMWSGAMSSINRAATTGSTIRTEPGDPRVGGDDPDLALHLEPIADDAIRFSSTSARLPPASRCVSTAVTKNRTSSSGIALGEVPQRVLERHAEVLLVVEHPELGPDRVVHLLGHHRQARREGVAGAQGPDDQADRFGEQLLEALASACSPCSGRTGTGRPRRPRPATSGQEQSHRSGGTPLRATTAARHAAARKSGPDRQPQAGPIDEVLHRPATASSSGRGSR